MLKTRAICFVLITSLCAVPLLVGQGADRGTIQGIVTDKSGAVVPGVTITIRNQATSVEMVMVSEGAGSYRFPALVPGNYYLRAELAGFTPYEVKTVIVNVGRVTDVNMALEPKGTAETITVNEVSPLVETTKTDIGGVVDNREASNAPLNGRNFSDLATLIPGAAPVTSWDPTKTRIGAIAIAGGGGRNVNTTVDGIDNKDNSVGGWVQNVPLEGIREFALKTQRFSAADGRSQGGLLSIVTKSGSNDFHASWFTLFRDQALNHNDYWSEHNKVNKPPFRRWQYGGSFGGPIAKDKLFFFFTYERLQEDTFTIMSPDSVAQLQALVDAKVNIYGAVPGPVAQLGQPYRSKMWTARADWVINTKNNFYVSWNNSSDRTENDQGPTDLTSTNYNTNRNFIASAVLNSMITPKLVNQLVWGSSYWNNLIDTNSYSPVTVTFASVSFGTNGNVPQQTFQKKWQIKDSVSWNRGSHSWKFGGDWVIEPWLGGFFGYTPVPALTFFDNPTTILTDKVHYPQGFSTPGIINTLAESNGVQYSRYTYPNYINFASWYVQDDWRVSRKLTLNLGVRYDVDLGIVGPDALKNNRTYLALMKINDPLTNGFKNKLPQNDRNNFAPRIGFAFDPTGEGKTVIRGGYGMYYDQLFNNINLFAMQQSFDNIFGTVFNKSNSSIGNGELSSWVVNQTPLPIPGKKTDFAAGDGATGRLVDPNYVSPLSQQLNIGFSREFAKDYVLEVDYTHLLNIHENRTIRLNWKIVKPDGSNPRRLADAFTAAGIAPSTWADWQDAASVNRSRFDGLNIQVRKRLSHRFTMQTSYSLAKAQGYLGQSGTFGGSAYDQNNYMAPNELAPTTTDERHRFVWSGVLDIPWGFQVAPIIQLASARPFATTAGTDLNKDGITNELCVPGATGAHGFVCPQNVSRNGQRGGYDLDGNWQSGNFFLTSVRVTKFVNLGKIKEGMNLGFTFEAFNLTNRINFGRNFATSIRATNFLTSLGPATGTYGITAATPFQAQLGVRFGF